MPLSQQEIQAILPVLDAEQTVEAPTGHTTADSDVQYYGNASIFGLPNATKGSQVVPLRQLSNLLSNSLTLVSGYIDAISQGVESIVNAARAAVNTEIQTLNDSLVNQLSDKVSQEDFADFMLQIQSANVGLKFIEVPFDAIVDSKITIGTETFLEDWNGVTIQNGMKILLNNQQSKKENGFYDVIDKESGQIVRDETIDLAAGSTLFYTGEGDYAGSYLILQGDKSIVYGDDDIKFTLFPRFQDATTVSGSSLKMQGTKVYLDEEVAGNEVFQSLGMLPPKKMIVGSGSSKTINIKHDLGCTSFWTFTVKRISDGKFLPLTPPEIVDNSNVKLTFSSPQGSKNLEVILGGYVEQE